MKAATNYASVCGVRKFCRWVLSGLIIATACESSYANILSWSGGGPDGNWSTAANWGFVGTPNNGDTLIFSASQPRLINTNNIAGLTLNQIRFVGAGGGYQIFGNGFTITNGILATNTAGVNAFSMPSNSITIATIDLSIVVSNGATLAIFAPLTGTPGLVKNGTGTLILEGPVSNTYGGVTTVNAGLVQLQKNGSAARGIPGDFIVGNGSDTATLQDIFGNEIFPSVNVTVNANGTWDMGGHFESLGSSITLNGNGSIINAGLQFFSGTTITANPGFLENCSISGVLFASGPPCNFVVNSGFLDGSLVVSASVQGTAVMNKTGNGFLDFSGANSFNSQLNILAGTLGAESTQALGALGSSTTVSNTATLAIYSSVSNKSVVIASTGIGIENASGVNTLFATNLTLAVPTTIEVDGTSFELFGTIGGTGGFTKTGASPLTLSGNAENTYLGTTIVSSGVLQLNNSSFHSIGSSSGIVVGNSADAAGSDVVRYINANGNQVNAGIPITINESGLYDLNGHLDNAGPFTINGGDISTGTIGALDNTGTMTVTSSNRSPTISGNLEMEGDSIFVDDDASFFGLTISANISDFGTGFSLINGPNGGALTQLTGSNSFTGPLTIGGLVVAAETPWALGSSNGATTVNASGTLFLFQTKITNETVTLAGGSVFAEQSTCSWFGPVVLTGNTAITNFDATLFDVAGPISGTGNLTTAGSGGTVRFSGGTANSYLGLTTVAAGNTLALNKTAANGAIPGNVVVNNGGTLRLANDDQISDAANVTVNSGGLYDFSTFSDAIDTLTGSGNVTFGVSGFLQIGMNNGTSTFNGLMSGPGFGGGYTVGKFGNGTFTMTANNTYQNGSDVFEGALIINGTQPQSPIRALFNGATLGGFGVVGDIPTASGTIAPGAAGSPELLTCSNLIFNSSGSYTVKLNGPNPGVDYDQVVARGSINLGTATLNVLPGVPPVINQQFTIIKNAGPGAVVGTFAGLPNNGIVSGEGYSFRINYNGGLSGKDVVLTAVGGNTLTLNSVYQGWYDSTGFHDPSNTNYLCGGDGFNLYRDFFVFNAPSVSGASIIGAELIINCYTNGPVAGQTYLVRGVSTPIGTLETGGSGLVGIYGDLGSNSVYSERTVETNESGQFAIIPLNVKFFNDIAAAAGGQIALGGSILNPSLNSSLFSFSGKAANDVRLRLTYGNTVTLGSADTGWYDSTGSHTAANQNYIAGTAAGNTYHDFFMFNLPVISGPLIDAQLLVSNYTDVNPAGLNPYQLHDVTTPITTLTNNAVGATGTFDDLASGVLYGGRNIYVSESGLQSGIPLNSQFVSAVYAQSGSQIALGGMNSSTNGVVFSSSGFFTNDARLWLGFLAVPATTPVFVNSTNIGGGKVQFTLSGTSGTSNEIQGSMDFTNWDYMGDLVMTNTTSVFTYTNSYPTPPTSFPYRFFRARITP